jgi:NADPH:quinone reductase-like Zn-dependent oxidoreductase
MKAIVQERYGPPDVLALSEIEAPEPGPGEVLIRVRASSVHPDVWHAVHGIPFALRLMGSGLRRPKYQVPGTDVAGVVEAVGSDATRFRPGDEVFGETLRANLWRNGGAYAEYVAVAQELLEPKPDRLTWPEAAAAANAGKIAVQGLRDEGRIRAGHRVLINGAGGGVGTAAVQIAKAFGAEVTGVCSTGNVDLVRSLGADRVIDYTRDDFTQGGPPYDLILDNIENRSVAEVRRVLSRQGTLVLNSGSAFRGLRIVTRVLWPAVRSRFVSHNLRRFLSGPHRADLELLKRLVEEGRLRPVIGNTFPLTETSAALRHIETGHARGKVVVAVT